MAVDPKLIEKLRQDIVFEAELIGRRLIFHSTWGLFSPKEIDEGTRLLLRHVEVRENDRCLDLGCGYGPIGMALAAQAHAGEVLLVDKDFVAVEYARKNLRVNQITNARVILSNGFSHVPKKERFTLIASNVPAKAGRELLTLWFYDSWRHLEPGGRLAIVGLTGLRKFFEKILREIFGNYEKVKQGKHYTVALSIKE